MRRTDRWMAGANYNNPQVFFFPKKRGDKKNPIVLSQLQRYNESRIVCSENINM